MIATSRSALRLIVLVTSTGIVLAAAPSWAGSQSPELVSVNSDGTAANESSFGSAVSGNGQYVAFVSNASDLVTGDTNDRTDVFVRDLASGVTERVSIDSNGIEGNEYSQEPALSDDGRYVTFISKAQLAPADSNGRTDNYVHDRLTGETTLVSVNLDGVAGNSSSAGIPDISANGRYVAFTSGASDLTLEENHHYAVFVRDLQEEVTELVSVNRQGNAANRRGYAPTLSAAGRYVAFFSDATNLKGAPSSDSNFDVFVRDRQAQSTELVSVARNGGAGSRNSMFGSISNDGRLVAFSSAASNLVEADTDQNFDIFVRNLDTQQTRLVSARANGSQSRRPSTRPQISPDGRFVAFTSEATLVAGETNDAPDAYLWDRGAQAMELISANPITFDSGDACYADGVSRMANSVSFQSSGAVFDPLDTNGSHSDIYLRTR